MSNSLTYQMIAENLRRFGYSDVTAKMIREIDEAMQADQPLPHGVIGMFAKEQLETAEEGK